MTFPQYISFTITNVCNLRCKMCGQWSKSGYMRNKKEIRKSEIDFNTWKKLIDELAVHNITSILLRGGEPFMFPEIVEILDYLKIKGIFT